MRFCFSGAFSPAGDLSTLARAGDAAGWDTMTFPDHLINPVETRSTYPYTADGGRRWEMGTEWPDPWLTIAHLAGMTERLRFLTTVYILPARTPVHVAKQVGTAAVLSGGRVELGVGMGWMAEEFDAMGVPFGKRGKRADEMLEVMRKLWTGEVVEHHGEHFDVPPVEMLPAPSEPVRVHVGGTSDAALRRAARNDGWVSDLHTTEELAEIRQRIERYREEYDRTHVPFSVYGSASDAWDLDGYRRVHDAGVTHLVTMPWYFYAGAEADLQGKVDGIERFAEDVIARW
ncbi:MAG: TIGR03619 family F420-dependent LLM class oxidoreductase [Acidimicrobiales bacterium]